MKLSTFALIIASFAISIGIIGYIEVIRRGMSFIYLLSSSIALLYGLLLLKITLNHLNKMKK